MAFAPKKDDTPDPERRGQATADAAFGRWVVDKAVHDDALELLPQLSALGSAEEDWRSVLNAFAHTFGASAGPRNAGGGVGGPFR